MARVTARAVPAGDIWIVDLWDLEGNYLGMRRAISERGARRVMANHSKRIWNEGTV
jgi:hypothetical protein